MIQKALDWARKTNNIRVNEIHGEEEIHMILSETFCHKELQEEETNQKGSIAVEARFSSITYSLIDNGDPPNIHVA